MRTVPAPRAGAPAGYALGVARHRWNRWDQRPDLFEHGGGGFGFLSDLWWLPQLGIGVADPDQLPGPSAPGRPRAVDPGRPRHRAGCIATGCSRCRRGRRPRSRPVVRAPAGMASLVANAAMPATGDRGHPLGGLRRPTGRRVGRPRPDRPAGPVRRRRGRPLLRGRRRQRTRPFATASPRSRPACSSPTTARRSTSGAGPDLAEPPARSRLGRPAPWQWAILGTAALLAVTWVVAAGANHTADRRADRRARPASRRPPPAHRTAGSAQPLVVLATVTFSCGSRGSSTPGSWAGSTSPSPSGWPCTCRWPSSSSAAHVALVASGFIGRWWSRAVRLEYAALAVAAVALAVLLAGWGLIGWGIT